MRRFAMLALAVAAPLPALAQEAAPAAASPAPVDPARLALAQATVQAVFPPGTYARIMDRSLQGMVGPMMDSIGKVPLRDLAGIGGLTDDQVSKIGPGSIMQIMEIVDPAYRQRSQGMLRAMFRELSGMMTAFEPRMRDGLAHAYARRFDRQQLADMNAFFATPSGKAYAAEAMTIFTDPDVTSTMQAFVPEMLKQMPVLVKKVEAENAGLPRRKELADLTPAERKRLAELLGVPESQLKPRPHK